MNLKRFLWLLLFLIISLPSFAVDYNKFDINDINSIQKATKEYQKEFENKRGTKEAEQDYLNFLKFYNKAVNAQSKKITFEYQAYDNSFEKQAQEYSKKYFPKGMIVHFDEGEFFLVDCNQYLYDEFSPYLTKDWKEFLKFETRFDKRIISDGRYRISKAEIKNFIHFYENFIKKYPDFTEKNNIKQRIINYKENLKHYPNIIY